VSWNEFPTKGGAPKREKRWAAGLGEVLGRGKVTKRAPRSRERQPICQK
jgi:hypothetical protein